MIDLNSPLKLINSFRFPIQNKIGRKEILIGGLFMLIPFIGWILNMGHRIQFVHQMIHGKEAFPAWKNYPQLLRNGFFTFLGMIYYNIPTFTFLFFYVQNYSIIFLIASIVCSLMAIIAIPGYMTHFCIEFNLKEIFNPFLALGRCFQIGKYYWYAWGIAICSLFLSFLGLIGLGIGFLFTSVWFWQVAGFSFASVFTRYHNLCFYKKPIRN